MATSTYPVTLMTNLRQPTDAFVGSAPLLWQYHARDFQHLALVMMWTHTPPPGYEYIRSPSFPVTATAVRRVAVAELSLPLPTRTVPTTKTTPTETSPRAPEERDVAVTVPEVSTVRDVPESTSVTVVSIPAVAACPRGQLAPNPFSGRVPQIHSWFDDGRGARPVVEAAGCGTSCHICGVIGTIKRDDWSHSKSQGSQEHVFESKRQEAWFHVCLICNTRCSGFVSFREHVAGKKHMRKAVLLKWPEQKAYCLGLPFCRLKCCRPTFFS